MAVATISVNFANAAEVSVGTETAKSINPAVLNQALRSGNFGDANVAALTSRATVVAPFFKGSGSQLTDLLTLTGGIITLTVGSSGKFARLQSALNSLSAFAFDDTADVQVLLASETFIESTSIDLSHDFGDRITVRGVGDFNFKSLKGSPVLSVSGINTPVLSATIVLDPSSDVPAVGDYVNIFSVSGRDASYLTALNTLDLAGGVDGLYAISLGVTNVNNPSGKLRTGEGLRTVNVGDVAVVTLLSGGNATTTSISRVYTVSSIAIKNYGYERAEIRFANAPSLPGASISTAVVQLGNPDSYIGNTFTQVSAAGPHVTCPDISNNYVLTFSTATPTNTYLNPGDQILALGQTRIVEAVSSNNKCFLDAPFRTGRKNLPGYNVLDSFNITTPTNYLVKTVYERYRGCHRVAAVNGTSDITIEIPDYGFFLTSMKGSTCARTPISGLPLPRYGVRSIGNAFNVIDQFAPAIVQNFPQAKILKTKLDFSNINSTSVYPTLTSINAAEGFGCLYLNNAKLRMLDNLVVLNNGLTKQHGLRIGVGLPGEIASQSVMTHGTSGVGIVGTFNYHILVTNNSTLNINNLGIGVYLRNFTQIVRLGVLDSLLAGEYGNIIYTRGCLGNVDFLTSVSPANSFTVPTGTISNYTATNAFGSNSINASSETFPSVVNVLLQRRSSGFAEVTNGVGNLVVRGLSIFSNTATNAHRCFNLGASSRISYANLIGAGTYCEGLGSLRNSNFTVHSAIINMNAGFNSLIQNCLISGLAGINAGYGQGTIKIGAKSPSDDWTHFYFCNLIANAHNSNTTIDFAGNAVFSNNGTAAGNALFYFPSNNCSILALNSISRNNFQSVDGYGTANYIDVATANQYTPPTVQTF